MKIEQNNKQSFWKSLDTFIDSWSWKVWLIGAIYFALYAALDFNKHSYIWASFELFIALSWFRISYKKARES